MAFFKRALNNRKNKKKNKNQDNSEQVEQHISQQDENISDSDVENNSISEKKGSNSGELLGNVGIEQKEIQTELDSISGFFNEAHTDNVPVRGFFNRNLNIEGMEKTEAVSEQIDLSSSEGSSENTDVEYLNLNDVMNIGDEPKVLEEAASGSFNEDLRLLTESDKEESKEKVPEYSLAFADLSDRDDISGEYIENASEIYGIKYPAGFDVNTVDYTGRAIDHSDFSLVRSLRWHHIAGASNITGIIFPAEFDIENCDFFGKNISGCDFSAVYALRWYHIENAKDISAIKYPPTFDIGNADFSGRNIASSDFSLVRGLTFEHLKNAAEISGIKYPADYDIRQADYIGKSVAGSDFSLVHGLKWDNIKASYNISALKYPTSFNTAVADYHGRNIAYSDFSGVSSLRWAHIKDALKIDGIKYPEEFDAENADFNGKDISNSNFSRVSRLRFKNIQKALNIKGIIYPAEFDIKNADFVGRNIDNSDFSNITDFDLHAVELAESKKNVLYPQGYKAAKYSPEEVQGAMLYWLVKMHHMTGTKDKESVYADSQELYPGMAQETIDSLLSEASSDLSHKNGEVLLKIKAKSAHIGEKLFLAKLGFKHIIQKESAENTVKMLREVILPICRDSEVERLNDRINGLAMGEYLSEREKDELNLEPVIISEHNKAVNVENAAPITENTDNELIQSTDDIINGEVAVTPEIYEIKNEFENLNPKEAVTEPVRKQQNFISQAEEYNSAERTTPESVFSTNAEGDSVDLEDIEMPGDEDDDDLEGSHSDVSYIKPSEIKSNNNLFFNKYTEEMAKGTPYDVIVSKEPEQENTSKEVDSAVQIEEPKALGQNVVLPDFSPPADSVAYAGGNESDEELSSEERKAIRTGVMGMLLYIKRNSSDDKLSFSDLSKAFSKIYPSVPIKEASAMAQFSSNVLSGNNAEMKDKLFSFALKASVSVKRFLLDYTLEQYRRSSIDWDDEKMFLVFLKALCETLFDEGAKEEYDSFLEKNGILKNPDTSMQPQYKEIQFRETLGKVNLFSNENFPFYRTLEMVGFAHNTFEALSSSLKIEVSDDKPYNDIANLIYRDVEPGLRQFVVIESSIGFLYVEKRTLEEWEVEETDVWRAAERNMESVDFQQVYCFSSYENTPYRYIQDDLASYVLYRRKLLKKLAGGKDMLIGVPCRETVYLDTYSFTGAKAMLNLVENHNNKIMIDGEEYEHNVADDIFIYRVVDGTLDRIRNEDYILLSDSEARRDLLNSVAPDVKPAADLSEALKTDEVYCMTEKEYVIQEAVYTVLKLYTYMNGENDYTVAENAMMGIFDDVSIAFDAQYPAGDGRTIPDPMEHLDECAEMVASAGKSVNWLLVQAFEKLCEKESYETATAASIRKTVLNTVYGDNANIVWLSAGAANDFEKRFNSTKRFHEKFIENAKLFFLDSEVETVMHALTLMFHQYGKRYALGQVRRHIVNIIPDIEFNYEQSQSAWLPEEDSNIELEVQSLGMVIRSIEPRRKEAIFRGLADAIGDSDLKNCGWPLMVFAKIAKNAYFEPADAINRYFAKRSTAIPTAAAIKAMSFKDLNGEFLKHSRLKGSGTQKAPIADNSGEITTDIHDPLAVNSLVIEAAKPEICFAPTEKLMLNSELSYIIEPSENPVSRYLKETAYSMCEFFRVNDDVFNPTNDPEAEILASMLRSSNQFTTLRSLAWTITDMLRQQGRELPSVNTVDVDNAAEYVRLNNRLTYRFDELYPGLCGTPVNHGLYLPIQQEYIFFAQSNIPDTPIASLFTLQQELSKLIPVMRVITDCLRLSLSGVEVSNIDILCDSLAAWCALATACGTSFTISPVPETGYELERVKR